MKADQPMRSSSICTSTQLRHIQDTQRALSPLTFSTMLPRLIQQYKAISMIRLRADIPSHSPTHVPLSCSPRVRVGNQYGCEPTDLYNHYGASWQCLPVPNDGREQQRGASRDLDELGSVRGLFTKLRYGPQPCQKLFLWVRATQSCLLKHGSRSRDRDERPCKARLCRDDVRQIRR